MLRTGIGRERHGLLSNSEKQTEFQGHMAIPLKGTSVRGGDSGKGKHSVSLKGWTVHLSQ